MYHKGKRVLNTKDQVEILDTKHQDSSLFAEFTSGPGHPRTPRRERGEVSLGSPITEAVLQSQEHTINTMLKDAQEAAVVADMELEEIEEELSLRKKMLSKSTDYPDRAKAIAAAVEEQKTAKRFALVKKREADQLIETLVKRAERQHTSRLSLELQYAVEKQKALPRHTRSVATLVVNLISMVCSSDKPVVEQDPDFIEAANSSDLIRIIHRFRTLMLGQSSVQEWQTVDLEAAWQKMVLKTGDDFGQWISKLVDHQQLYSGAFEPRGESWQVWFTIRLIKDCDGFKPLVEPWLSDKRTAPTSFAQLIGILRDYHRNRAESFRKPKPAPGAVPPAAFLASRGGSSGGSKSAKGICFAFQKKTGCARGDSCDFAHVKGGEPPTKTGASKTARPYAGGGPTLCFTMLNTGDCAEGDSCPNKATHKQLRTLYLENRAKTTGGSN